MSKTFCDACGRHLKFERDACLTGTRTNGLSGGGLPAAGVQFHLCALCAVVAFHAAVTNDGRDADQHALAGEINDVLRKRERAA